MTVSLETEDPGVVPALEALAEGLPAAAAKTAQVGGVTAADALRREIRNRLAKRSQGRLAGSVRTEETHKGTTTEVEAGPTLIYAGVQNEGSTNHGARAGRAMAIPTFGASSPASSPRGLGGLVAVPVKGGPVLAVRDAKRRLKTLFFLRRSVSIPGVHYQEAAAQSVEPTLPATTERAVTTLVEEASRAARS